MKPFFTACALLFAIPCFAPGQGGVIPEFVRSDIREGESYLVQRSSGGTLILSPNESFFPALGLKAAGSVSGEDFLNLNGGNHFAHIEGWDEGEEAEWALLFERPGSVEVSLDAEGGGRFSLILGDASAKQVSDQPGGFQVEAAGAVSMRLRCDDPGSGAKVKMLHLSGPAVEGASVIRKRWRPAAAHTKFTSSRSPEKIRLWIMEMDAVPGELDFYSPITTPFGYYGPTWKADGTVNSGINFSLWSFSRGKPEPPVEQLSHLVAIGNPDATFGGFDHEGTGVKIRDWQPLEGRRGQRQALALRVEPGERYDTYHSYFFASDEKRWRLFGSGKKWNKGRPLENLWVGSFVEVPGPPPVQRTGLYERTMRYRGWVMDAGGKWHVLDQMQNGNIDKESGLTHTDRGTTDDGWFYLTTGRWVFRDPPNRGKEVKLSASGGRPDVDYLDPEDLEFLQRVPTTIEVTNIERRIDKARVTLQIDGVGDDAELIAYYGPQEGLTFADRWAESLKVSNPREGENQIVIEGVDAASALHVRVFLKNEEGQFWSRETETAEK